MLFEEIIQSHYRPSEYPALASLAEEWQDSRPFEGLKILVATPIFRNTLLQYEALLAGGAELYVGRAPEQVEEYLRDFIQPILDENKDLLGEKAELSV